MKEIIIKAVLVKSIDDVDIFNIRLTDEKYMLIRKSLELQKKNIMDMLDQMKKKDHIKSVYIPKNKYIQKKLDRLVLAKRTIKNSIDKIKELYYK